MRCPSCDSEVPGRDLVCGECGAFVYRNVPPAPREPEESGDFDLSPRYARVAGRSPVPNPRLQQPRSTANGYPTGSGGPDYVYPTLQGWPGLGPDEALSAPSSQYDHAEGGWPIPSGQLPPPPQGTVPPGSAHLRIVNEAELQRRGRIMGRWSIGLAVLSLLIPLVGPVGIVTGYFAWRLGETRLGRIGVIASVCAMVAGVAITILIAPPGTG